MRYAALLCLLAGPALAETIQTDAPSLSAAPTEWLGEAPHLVMMGKLNGRDINIQLMDTTAAWVEEFAGKREYLPKDGGAYRLGDFEVSLKAKIGGVERSFELEFENDDFAALTLPATLALGPQNFPKGNAAFLEASAEWEDAAGAVNDEIGGFSGSLVYSLDQGTQDDKGLTGDGLIGGYAVADLGGETLVISFTVPVADYEIDD